MCNLCPVLKLLTYQQVLQTPNFIYALHKSVLIIYLNTSCHHLLINVVCDFGMSTTPSLVGVSHIFFLLNTTRAASTPPPPPPAEWLWPLWSVQPSKHETWELIVTTDYPHQWTHCAQHRWGFVQLSSTDFSTSVYY